MKYQTLSILLLVVSSNFIFGMKSVGSPRKRSNTFRNNLTLVSSLSSINDPIGLRCLVQNIKENSKSLKGISEETLQIMANENLPNIYEVLKDVMESGKANKQAFNDAAYILKFLGAKEDAQYIKHTLPKICKMENNSAEKIFHSALCNQIFRQSLSAPLKQSFMNYCIFFFISFIKFGFVWKDI